MPGASAAAWGEVMSGAAHEYDWLMHQHLPSAVLTRFWQGRMSANETELLESHVLLCPVCQQQLVADCISLGARWADNGIPSAAVRGFACGRVSGETLLWQNI